MQLSEYRVKEMATHSSHRVHVAAVIEGPGKNSTTQGEKCPRRALRMYRVRGLEKARFGERTRPALYRNGPPLMRREGAAVGLVSCCTDPRKE